MFMLTKQRAYPENEVEEEEQIFNAFGAAFHSHGDVGDKESVNCRQGKKTAVNAVWRLKHFSVGRLFAQTEAQTVDTPRGSKNHAYNTIMTPPSDGV